MNIYTLVFNRVPFTIDILGLSPVRGSLTTCTPWIWTFETRWRYTGAEKDMERIIPSITLLQLVVAIKDWTLLTSPLTTVEVWDIYRAREVARYRKYVRACVDLLYCRFYEEEQWRRTGARRWEYHKHIRIEFRSTFGDERGGGPWEA